MSGQMKTYVAMFLIGTAATFVGVMLYFKWQAKAAKKSTTVPATTVPAV